MKKFTIITFITFIISMSMMAQKMDNVLIKVKADEVPKEVLESVAKDFPGIVIEEYTLLQASAYMDQMVAHGTNEPETEEVVYMVDVHEKDTKANAIYDAEGNLLQIRGKVKDYVIPASVLEYIEKEYPDYEILKEKEVIKTKKDGVVDHFVIKIKKDKWVKKLYFNEEGELLKAKDE